MDITWFIRNLLASFLLPPMCFVLPILTGVALLRYMPKLGKTLILLSTFLLYLASIRFVASALMAPLEQNSHFQGQKDAQAIVILSGGRRHGSEYDGQITLSDSSLVRLRYGAWLAKQTGLPILLTGGAPEDGGTPEAHIMQQVLQQDYQLSAKWLEIASRTTQENAGFSLPILKAAGIRKLILVSDGWHLPRAQLAFQQPGITVYPAGVNFTPAFSPWPRNWIPSALSLEKTSWAMHEYIGLLWYRF
ncbi:YdcF family protein [Leeia oryzae]|uniref:YdcF family protein n=1 Tax=Leeia oryzae TaxID=356662 RepID=UPI0003659387|nr:YdcF family protein [Leeia oryzae]